MCVTVSIGNQGTFRRVRVGPSRVVCGGARVVVGLYWEGRLFKKSRGREVGRRAANVAHVPFHAGTGDPCDHIARVDEARLLRVRGLI